MALFNSMFSYQIRVVRIGEGHLIAVSQGRLGLVSSLENIPKAENMAPSHLYSHRSTSHSTPLSFACYLKDTVGLYMRPHLFNYAHNLVKK